MKKLILLLFIPLVSFGQDLNKEVNGYTEVIQVELTKDDIYQKLNEWVAVSYSSANEVTQLNKTEKIIIKGILTMPYTNWAGKLSLNVYHSLTFSIREGRFKVDFIANSVTNSSGGLADISLINVFLTEEAYTKEQYLQYMEASQRSQFATFGYSEKKIDKMIAKYLNDANQTNMDYKHYIDNRTNWMNEINNIFNQIDEYVNKSEETEEDW